MDVAIPITPHSAKCHHAAGKAVGLSSQYVPPTKPAAASTAVHMYPRLSACIGSSSSRALTTSTPMIEATSPKARATSGNSISPTTCAGLKTSGFASASPDPRIIAPMFSAAVDSNRSAPRPAPQRDLERLVEARARRARRPDVRAHGDVHADDAGHARAEGAEHEGQGGREREGRGGRLSGVWLAEERVQHVDHDAERNAQRADGAILAPQEGFRAFLDRVGDLPHLGGAVVLPEHVAPQAPGAVQGEDREPEDENHQHSRLWLLGARAAAG